MIDPDHLREIIEQQIPFHAHLKLQIEALDEHFCILRIPYQASLTGDGWHAGLINSGISAAGGAVAMVHIDLEKDRISTLNTRADFLNPSLAEDLIFEAHIIKAGKTIIQTQVTVRHSAQTKAIASGIAIFSVKRG